MPRSHSVLVITVLSTLIRHCGLSSFTSLRSTTLAEWMVSFVVAIIIGLHDHHVFAGTPTRSSKDLRGSFYLQCLCCQPAGDVSHKPSNRLPLHSAVFVATFLGTEHHCRWLVTGGPCMWTTCLWLLCDSRMAGIESASCRSIYTLHSKALDCQKSIKQDFSTGT